MGLEPTTFGLTSRCSNQLSYRTKIEDSLAVLGGGQLPVGWEGFKPSLIGLTCAT